MIDGPPGSGKSALLDAFRTRMGNKARCISGKFPQFLSGSPQKALADALDDYLTQAFAMPEPEFRALKALISTRLKAQTELIADVVPGFKLFLDRPTAATASAKRTDRAAARLTAPASAPTTASTSASTSASSADSSARSTASNASASAGAGAGASAGAGSGELSADAEAAFGRAFTDLFTVLASTHPLIWFTDDLQWATPAPLRVIENVLTSGIQNVLVVSTWRSTERLSHAHALLDKARCVLRLSPVFCCACSDVLHAPVLFS